MTPQLWVFAGPNGAGKSTIVERYVAGRIPVVNPDIIATTLSADLNVAARMIRAGRIAVAKRDVLLNECRTFAIETTLTGRSELAFMQAARVAGFKVNLVYVGLRDVNYSIGRVRSRVAAGGHDVPLPDLLRRFDRSIASIRPAMALADRSILVDNHDRRGRLILWREGTRTKFAAAALPDWARLL